MPVKTTCGGWPRWSPVPSAAEGGCRAVARFWFFLDPGLRGCCPIKTRRSELARMLLAVDPSLLGCFLHQSQSIRASSDLRPQEVPSYDFPLTICRSELARMLLASEPEHPSKLGCTTGGRPLLGRPEEVPLGRPEEVLLERPEDVPSWDDLRSPLRGRNCRARPRGAAAQARASRRRPRGVITRSASSNMPCTSSASSAAGTAPSRIRPMSSRRMPVRIGWP